MPAEVAELVEALASLGERLAKAGPALWSLIGSALFLIIAALSAGVFQQAAEPSTVECSGASNTVKGNVAASASSNSSAHRPSNENLKLGPP